jgi:hypothetical protein
MKPILRFNNGRGAVTCEKCDIIVDQDFDKDEWDALCKLNVPCYCKECNIDGYKKFKEEFQKEIKKNG